MVTRDEPPAAWPPVPIVTRTDRPLAEGVVAFDSTAAGAAVAFDAAGFWRRTWSIVSRRTWPECWRAETSLAQRSISSWASTPRRPTTVGTDRQTSRRP